MRIIFQFHQFSLDINQCENEVSCLLQGPPTTHPALPISPSPHLRETGSVASHGSVESPQSPPVTTPRAAWVEPGFQLPNNPTATSSRCRPAALVQHKAIQLSNRRIILLARVQCIINGGDNLALIWEMIVYVGCRRRCRC